MLYSDELYHHGIKGQKWGVRRFQNKDGTLTAEGRQRLTKNGDGQKAEKKFRIFTPRKQRVKENRERITSEVKEIVRNSPKLKSAADDWNDAVEEYYAGTRKRMQECYAKHDKFAEDTYKRIYQDEKNGNFDEDIADMEIAEEISEKLHDYVHGSKDGMKVYQRLRETDREYFTAVKEATDPYAEANKKVDIGGDSVDGFVKETVWKELDRKSSKEGSLWEAGGLALEGEDLQREWEDLYLSYGVKDYQRWKASKGL